LTEDVFPRTRAWFYLSLAAVIAASAGVASISAEDPEGWALRLGVILMISGATMWLPLPALALTVPGLWLAPSLLRAQISGDSLLGSSAMLEIPGLLALAAAMAFLRHQVRVMEEQSERGAIVSLTSELDEETGVYHERLLAESIERELVRSRRFGREFALMLAGVDSLRAKFDYREDEKWDAGLKATAAVLLNTRTHIDRVYRYGLRDFALLLPETGPKDITGLVRRLGRAAKRADPPEGEPGGPLPLHFGVTFFPQCATTVEDLLRRAEVALRLAEKSPTRVQLDGAEAPDLPAPELARRADEDEEQEQIGMLAGQWLGAEAPEEEQLAGQWFMPGAAPTVQTVIDTASAREAQVESIAPSVQDEAEAVAAQSWLGGDSGDEGGDMAEAGGMATVPEAPAAAEFAGSVADMLKRMDETLGLLRKARLGPD
jgi:diguanylate cyclase (GGDEF)-like protein